MIYICRTVSNDCSDRSDMSNNETASWGGPRSLEELEQLSLITRRKGGTYSTSCKDSCPNIRHNPMRLVKRWPAINEETDGDEASTRYHQRDAELRTADVVIA